MDESSASKVFCSVCKNSVDANGVISLTKALKDDTVIEVFETFIPNVVSIIKNTYIIKLKQLYHYEMILFYILSL